MKKNRGRLKLAFVYRQKLVVQSYALPQQFMYHARIAPERIRFDGSFAGASTFRRRFEGAPGCERPQGSEHQKAAPRDSSDG